MLGTFAVSAPVQAADFPQASISNGQITATVFLPDPVKGYYRSTRFDWSGAINSLQYKGHNYYGIWFDGVDPKVINKDFPMEKSSTARRVRSMARWTNSRRRSDGTKPSPAALSSRSALACCVVAKAITTDLSPTTLWTQASGR